MISCSFDHTVSRHWFEGKTSLAHFWTSVHKFKGISWWEWDSLGSIKPQLELDALITCQYPLCCMTLKTAIRPCVCLY